MNAWARLVSKLYRLLLACYPERFRSEFGAEMQDVFRAMLEDARDASGERAWQYFWREIRDWPGAIWREHLHSGQGAVMNENNLAWKPLNTAELLAGLALFVLPIVPPILKTIFGYSTLINSVGSIFLVAILVSVLILIVLGIKKGFPRWSLPYLGVSIIAIVMLQGVFPLWGLFASGVVRIVNYGSKTLAARILYSALLNGFFWLVPFLALLFLISLLRAWPHTRQLAQCIRQDWTLFSFMIYSGIVFQLELVFDEYAYDELWKIACRICLLLGAWIYFKNADRRKRILALLVGATLTYWIAAVGKWVVLPLQSWGDFYGYDHWTYRRFELGSTLATWIWVMFFMLIPALVRLLPEPKGADPTPDERLSPA